MGEGRKVHYIIVFLLILGLGLIGSILQGVLEIHLIEAAQDATNGYFPDISDSDRNLIIALEIIGLFNDFRYHHVHLDVQPTSPFCTKAPSHR